MKRILPLLLLLCIPCAGTAQPATASKLKEALNEYFENFQLQGYRPFNGFQVDSLFVIPRQRRIDIYPNESFYSQPLSPEHISQMKEEMALFLPSPYDKYELAIYGKNRRTLEEMVPNMLRRQGRDKSRMWGDTDYDGKPWVSRLSRPYKIKGGLDGRHFVVNPSHGRYYKYGEWRWQRPTLFCTTEDLFTYSFVYPFLVPMLENAGAIVCSARERDTQVSEAVVDNDDAPLRFDRREKEGAMTQQSEMGTYAETDSPSARWSTVATADICPLPPAALDTLGPTRWAFAYPGNTLADSINPFRLGTARQIHTTTDKHQTATAVWRPNLPRAGEYAVYISYASLRNSTDDARYTVYHKGGATRFSVNQQMGGGTWVYLGTFRFDAGEQDANRVELTNLSDRKGIVSADAVRFGGGRGQVVRDSAGASCLPRFIEAARYHTQWSGIPDSLYRIGESNNDYSADIRSRAAYANHLGGSSCYMPGLPGLRVPLELSLAVHSDAGTRRDGGIYGSMGICTTIREDTLTNYPSGIARTASMDLADALLRGLAADLKEVCGREWTRRELWDRNYGESRSPEVPSAILEILSHQNFEDLKYGHDPNFKFLLSRSVYKSLLRYVNYQHGRSDYAVQPLPVSHFAALLHPGEMSAILSWQPTPDPLEKSAMPKQYILYTRTGNGNFDNGQAIGPHTSVKVSLQPNVRYDFKVTAVNDGGESFPSEILSVFRNPASPTEILVVNGFERLSGPARIETADSVGFDLRKDLGVPYRYTAAFCGAQIDFNPEYAGQEGPGALGFSGEELAGQVIAGNTFDYAAEHGQAIAASGRYSYSSISRAALIAGQADLTRYRMMDYITGLEKDVPYQLKPYKSFPPAIRQILTNYLRSGGRLMVSGAYIASDMQSPEERKFTRELLKYEYAGNAAADSTGTVRGLNLEIPIFRQPNDRHYAAQNPDAILPADPDAFSAFLYGGGQGAGIAYPGKDYRVLAMAFPFECISRPELQAEAMDAIIRFLTE